jgi:ketosteroid isomerase-like protein
MILRPFFVLLLAVALSACGMFGKRGDGGGSDAQRIRAQLDEQVAAWNRGDIPGFMAGYWKSKQLRFASGDSVTTGWNETLARYQSRYGDKAAMGRLEFSAIEIELVDDEHAYAFGRWKLVRAKDAPHGLFTLILRKVKGEWRIVHDHTSTG